MGALMDAPLSGSDRHPVGGKAQARGPYRECDSATGWCVARMHCLAHVYLRNVIAKVETVIGFLGAVGSG